MATSVHIRLPDDLLAELDQVAGEANVSRSWMAREILRYTLRGLPLPALMTLPENRPGDVASGDGSTIERRVFRGPDPK